MSNLKIEILPLASSNSLQSLTDKEMSIRGQGDIDIDAGSFFGSADFEGATIAAYDLPPGYYEAQLQLAMAGIPQQ